jgi:hypothetical protein
MTRQRDCAIALDPNAIPIDRVASKSFRMMEPPFDFDIRSPANAAA